MYIQKKMFGFLWNHNNNTRNWNSIALVLFASASLVFAIGYTFTRPAERVFDDIHDSDDDSDDDSNEK